MWQHFNLCQIENATLTKRKREREEKKTVPLVDKALPSSTQLLGSVNGLQQNKLALLSFRLLHRLCHAGVL